MSGSAAVTRASLRRTFPIVAPMPMTLLPTRIWTEEQWERIQLGYQARDMDEKWNVFVEGHVAFLHRSWTGRGMFEASFSPVSDGWHITAAVAESDPEHVRTFSMQLNRVLLELVLSAILLGEPAADLRAELVGLVSPHARPGPPEGLVEHSVLGLTQH